MKLNLLIGLALFFLYACSNGDDQIKIFIDKDLPEDVESVIEGSIEDLAFVKSGSFQMGDFGVYLPAEKRNEGSWDYSDFVDKDYPDAVHLPWAPDYKLNRPTAEPVHEVYLSGYSIGKYEVTFSDYDAYTKDQGLPRLHEQRMGAHFRKPDYPVIGVTWQEAQDYCLWLAKKTGVSFSLPTEAQWEYAARGRGEMTAFATNAGFPEKGVNISSKQGAQKVGIYPPNSLGLYDMSGNAREWVLDWFAPDYYGKSPKEDPKGPADGAEKVVRSDDVVLQRYHEKPSYRGLDLGFRCAVNNPQPVQLK